MSFSTAKEPLSFKVYNYLITFSASAQIHSACLYECCFGMWQHWIGFSSISISINHGAIPIRIVIMVLCHRTMAFMNRYPSQFLDVDLMTVEDIDELYPVFVRIHLCGGSSYGYTILAVHVRSYYLLVMGCT